MLNDDANKLRPIVFFITKDDARSTLKRQKRAARSHTDATENYPRNLLITKLNPGVSRTVAIFGSKNSFVVSKCLLSKH